MAVFLINWHWVLLILTVPFFGLPSPWPLISIIGVPLIWTLIWLSGGKPLVKTPLNIPILILSVMILVSAWVTYDLKVSIGFVAGAVLGMAAFFTVARYARTPKGWWICFFLFVASNLFLTAAVALMVEWTDNKIELLSPIISRLGEPLVTISIFPRKPHPNIIAVFLLAVLPILIVFLISILGHRKRWAMIFGSKRTNLMIVFIFILSIIGIIILLLSQSRGGYIAFAAACLSMLLVCLPRRGRWLLLFGIVVISLVVVFQMRSGAPALELKFLQSKNLNDSALSMDSMEGRIDIWERAMYGIQDFPLTGMGMGTFGHIMPILYPLAGVSSDGIPLNAHNTYLQAALDLGFPGLIALLWVQIASLWMLFKSWRLEEKWQDDPNATELFSSIPGSKLLAKPILLGLGGVYCAYLLFGLVESFGLGVYILNWMLTGLIVGFYQQLQNCQKGEASASPSNVVLQGGK